MALDQLHDERVWELLSDLGVSLSPTGPDQFHQIAADYIPARAHVLDVGAGQSRRLVTISQRTGRSGGTVVNRATLDPDKWRYGRITVDDLGLSGRIRGSRELLTNVPVADATYDVVWCRDVLEVLVDLDASLAEAVRVLRPHGHLLAYTNVLCGPLDERENRLIHEPLGNVPANLVQANLERAFARAGLNLVRREVIGTEWHEHLEEREHRVSYDLIRLARLRRQREDLIDRYGERAYALAQASLHWGALQLMGRLVPIVYVLTPGPSLPRPRA